jgi:hypothetical protein
VVDVLRRGARGVLREGPLVPEQHRLLSSVLACRTPALGGQVLVCPKCGLEKTVYHSCRNRHCPNCQTAAQEKWIERRADSMLPVPHFHVVFTLPAELRALCRTHPKPMYDLLLRSCGDVLGELGQDVLGGQLGVTVVLHTWTRDLSYHVHAHCIVSAGVWDKDAKTFRPVPNNRYLFPAARMKAAFRARMLRGLRGLVQQDVVALPGGTSFAAFERSLPPKKRWVVYAQAPFGKFEHVLSYLGRYTHRVGISNSRLRDVTDTHVTFATRDGKTCTLSNQEFTRRFLQHVLPGGLKKIRHYGLYAPGAKHRHEAITALRDDERDRSPVLSNARAATDHAPTIWAERCCPHCAIELAVAHEIPRLTQPPWRPP